MYHQYNHTSYIYRAKKRTVKLSKLVVLVFGIFIGSFCLSQQTRETTSENSYSSYNPHNQANACDSFFASLEEDEEEYDTSFILSDDKEQGSRLPDFTPNVSSGVSSVGEQISPYHFTNLPPPHLHIILYS